MRVSTVSTINQGCVQYHCFDIQGAVFIQNAGRFMDSPGIFYKGTFA